MLNQTTLAGRLTRDPELRRIANGDACTTFTIAVDDDYAPAGKERGVDFFDCVAWRQKGEYIAKALRKGQMVVVTGRLKNRIWKDKNGSRHVNTELIVSEVYTMTPAGGNRQAKESVPTPNDDYAIHDEDAGKVRLPWEVDEDDD